jgi:predicted DNA binding CopG/RHH family protein
VSRKIEGTIEAWESGQLGADEESVRVASQETHDALDKCMNLKPISIRLPVSLIEELKIIADYNEVGYQPFIRKMLQRFATAELRKMAIELYSMAKLENEREKGTVENTTKTKKIG